MPESRSIRPAAFTVLIFLGVQPLTAGLCFAGLAALSGTIGDPPPGGSASPLMALVFGALTQIPAAGLTGFAMALLSRRIRPTAGWLAAGAGLGWLMAALISLFFFRATLNEGTGLTLFLAVMTALPAAPGGLAAAAASLRIRSRPWRRPVAEAFD